MGIRVTRHPSVNILSTQIGHDDWVRIFAAHPPRSVLPGWKSNAWRAASAKPLVRHLGAPLLERAELEAQVALPPLEDALYAQYAATGERLPFEKIYFERRRRLARAATALLLLGASAPESFRLSFIQKLEAVFEESSWAFPAHVGEESGRNAAVIDLFCAETANLMGELLAVFGAVIPAALRAKIRRRLRQQIFEGYCANDFFWMHSTNNWNAVCHQGVLGAALAVEDDTALLADMFAKATLHLPQFLRGFGADGGCSEGLQYWEYGFGRFAALNAQLEARTEGGLSLFYAEPKVDAIAGYAGVMSFADGTPVNFSDCRPQARPWPFLPRYLADALGREDCAALADFGYRRLWHEPVCMDSARADFFHWSRLLLLAPDGDCSADVCDASVPLAVRRAQVPAGAALAGACGVAAAVQRLPGGNHLLLPESTRGDVAIGSLGIWVVSGVDAQGRLWEVAAKGGHNDEHHNHNDVGSFILKIDGCDFISEIGMPEYCRDYFTPHLRYTFLAARSLGHSLAVINGQEQAAGAEYFGVVLHQDLSQDEVYCEMDLTQAYPASAGCSRYIRRLCLSKSNGSLRCVDRIELHEPGRVEVAFVSACEEAEILSASVAQLRHQGLVLQALCSGSLGWDRVEAHTYRDHDGTLRACQRLVLAGSEAAGTFTAIVNFRLCTLG